MTLETSSTPLDLKLRPLSGPTETAALSALLDRAFPVPPGFHFLDDFPIWNAALAQDTSSQFLRLGGFSNQQLVCFAGVRITKIKTQQGLLPIAIVGGVCTHPDWRGKQLASTIVSAAVQWASQQNAALIALWGSEHDLYRRLGFELCGSQVRVPLSGLNYTHHAETVQTGFTAGIFAALINRPSGLALSVQDLPWIKAHKNVHWFWSGSANQPTAYAALGKGIDLPDLVHEWGGTAPALNRLLASVHAQSPYAALLAHPNQLKDLGISYSADVTEFLCMVRVLNPSAILNAWRPGIPHSI
ncbi:MAG: GNAT family N-acetyltransferase, partial [Bdellovibrionota bacterium]